MQTQVYGEKYTLNYNKLLISLFLHARLRTCYINPPPPLTTSPSWFIAFYRHANKLPLPLYITFFYWSPWIHAITLSVVTESWWHTTKRGNWIMDEDVDEDLSVSLLNTGIFDSWKLAHFIFTIYSNDLGAWTPTRSFVYWLKHVRWPRGETVRTQSCSKTY